MKNFWNRLDLRFNIISVSSNASFLHFITNGRAQLSREEPGISYVPCYLRPPFNRIKTHTQARATFFNPYVYRCYSHPFYLGLSRTTKLISLVVPRKLRDTNNLQNANK